MPNVLHLLPCDDWGGTEVQVSTQVVRSDPSQSRQGVAILQPPGVLHERLRSAGVQVQSLAGPLGPVGALIRLVRLLRRTRPEILCAYGFRAGLVARAARPFAGRPALVIGVRGLHFTEAESPEGAKTRLVLAVERALQRTVARYDANSQGAVDFLVSKGFARERFAVIHNGVDLPAAPSADRGASDVPTAVCVARFVPRKRHALLLRALARLKERNVSFRCELVGYGPTFEPMRATAAELGLEEDVAFLGRLPQPDAVERLQAADLFVLPSLWEGMPGSVMEAMAAGVAVVATDVSGTNELVEHGTTGLLVPADDEAALADALGELLADPERRRAMGTAGLERARRRFSFERVVSAKTSLYAEVAGSRGR